jgi:hypothetical protein
MSSHISLDADGEPINHVYREWRNKNIFDKLLKVKHESLWSNDVHLVLSDSFGDTWNYSIKMGDISIICYTTPEHLKDGEIFCIIANDVLLTIMDFICFPWGKMLRRNEAAFHCSNSRELLEIIDREHCTYDAIIDKCADLEKCEDVTFAMFLAKKVKSARS